MSDITLPKLNQTGTNEWADVEDNDKAIRDVVNGNLDNGNIASSAAIAHSKLANATAGYVLKANGSGVITATSPVLPLCILAQTSNLSTSTAADETWASEIADTDGMHSTSVNTARITIQTAGYYRIVASLAGTFATAGKLFSARLKLNGSEVDRNTTLSVDPGNAERVQVELITVLSATNYLTVEFLQSSGGTLSMTKRFAAYMISPS